MSAPAVTQVLRARLVRKYWQHWMLAVLSRGLLPAVVSPSLPARLAWRRSRHTEHQLLLKIAKLLCSGTRALQLAPRLELLWGIQMMACRG